MNKEKETAIKNFKKQMEVEDGSFAKIKNCSLPSFKRTAQYWVSKSELKEAQKQGKTRLLVKDLDFKKGILWKSSGDDWSSWDFAKDEDEAVRCCIETMTEEEFIECYGNDQGGIKRLEVGDAIYSVRYGYGGKRELYKQEIDKVTPKFAFCRGTKFHRAYEKELQQSPISYGFNFHWIAGSEADEEYRLQTAEENRRALVKEVQKIVENFSIEQLGKIKKGV